MAGAIDVKNTFMAGAINVLSTFMTGATNPIVRRQRNDTGRFAIVARQVAEVNDPSMI